MYNKSNKSFLNTKASEFGSVGWFVESINYRLQRKTGQTQREKCLINPH